MRPEVADALHHDVRIAERAIAQRVDRDRLVELGLVREVRPQGRLHDPAPDPLEVAARERVGGERRVAAGHVGRAVDQHRRVVRRERRGRAAVEPETGDVALGRPARVGGVRHRREVLAVDRGAGRDRAEVRDVARQVEEVPRGERPGQRAVGACRVGPDRGATAGGGAALGERAVDERRHGRGQEREVVRALAGADVAAGAGEERVQALPGLRCRPCRRRTPAGPSQPSCS